MKAVTWHGKRDVRVDTVPDPKIEEPTDAIIEVTSTNICGSDLHLYEVLGAVHEPGRHPRPRTDGHRARGRLRGHATWRSVTGWSSRSKSPAAVAICATSSCSPSARRRRSATRAWVRRCSATPKLYGQVPGGQAELLRVPQAQFTHIKVPDGPAGLAVRLPVRRAADGMAGGRVCRHSRRGFGDGARARTDRRHGRTDRQPPGLPGDRRRQGARAARARAGARHADDRPQRARRRSRRRHPRHDRRARHRLGDRRRRDGGARFAGRQARATGHRPSA